MSGSQLQIDVGKRALDFDSLDDRSQAILLTEADEFRLSVRTRNVLAREGLKFFGEFVQIPEDEWLQFSNCGTKTVREIKVLASRFGLVLGTIIRNWPENALELSSQIKPVIPSDDISWSKGMVAEIEWQGNRIDFEATDKKTRAWLVQDLKELNLSNRAINSFTQLGLSTISDLIQISHIQLLEAPSCGRKTAKEITIFLEECGFLLNTKIDNWDSEAARHLQATLRRDKRTANQEFNKEQYGYVVDAVKSVEGELLAVLAIETSDRNAQLVAKLWGWFGKKPRTLESVGNEFGMTRERVRQIAAKASKKIEKRRLVTPSIIKAAQLLRESCPATAAVLREKLRQVGLSNVGIHPLGMSKACELLQIPLGLRVIEFGGSRIYSIDDIEIPFREFQREARRRTSTNGCVNFHALCDELNVSKLHSERIRNLVSDTKEFVWLNNDRTWFYSARPTRNRLINIASKVLFACPKLRPNELRKAVSRSRRLEIKPPVEVLENLIQAEDVATNEDGFLIANPDCVEGPEQGSIEDKFIRILRTHGPVMSGADFEERCIQCGINPISFYIYRAGSPVISQLSTGVYGLVGAAAPPGLIEELAAQSRGSKRLVEHGWDAEGRLWCAVSLSRVVITAGSIALPNFVVNLTQGEWKVALPDGTSTGQAVCKDNFFYPVRKPLQFLGAEPDDLVMFKFDLHSRVVLTEIGGPELIEAAEQGEFNHPTDD